MRGHKKFVWSVNFSPDGHQIVSGSYDRTARILDPTTGAEVLTTKRGPKAAVGPVVFSPDGTMILSATYDKTVRTWGAVTGVEISLMLGDAAVLTSLAFSADATKVVSGSNFQRQNNSCMGCCDRCCSFHDARTRGFGCICEILTGQTSDRLVQTWTKQLLCTKKLCTYTHY
jgi:WD40 repeat protein